MDNAPKTYRFRLGSAQAYLVRAWLLDWEEGDDEAPFPGHLEGDVLVVRDLDEAYTRVNDYSNMLEDSILGAARGEGYAQARAQERKDSAALAALGSRMIRAMPRYQK